MARTKKAVKDSTAKQQADKQKVKNDNINTQGTNKTLFKTQNMTSDIDIKEDNAPKRLPPGRKPIGDRCTPEFLEELAGYASQNIPNMKIAELLGIALSSFYKLMNENAEFKEAYEKGIDNRKYELEKALIKRAEGFAATEVKTEVDADGNITKKTVTDKNYVPDTTALIFSLKNLYGDKYKDRIESVNTVNINVQQIQNIPDEELLKYANMDLIEDAEYQID